MPGNSSAAYANYASVVKSIYDQRMDARRMTWPMTMQTAKVNVTIAQRRHCGDRAHHYAIG